MMRVTSVFVLLALPALALGQTASLSLVANGPTSWDTLTGGSVTVSIQLTAYSDLGYGVTNVDGYLDVSAGNVFTTSARAWGAPFNSNKGDQQGNINLNETIVGLKSTKNWGIANTSGSGSEPNFGYYMAPADGALPWTIETFTVAIPAGTLPGTYTMGLSSDSFVGVANDSGLVVNAATSLGSPVSFVITPEPATMLLLAAAVPFLRRRSA